MKTSPVLRRNVAALASVGIAATPLLTLAGPAFATDACQTTDPLATEISPTICEVVYNSHGDYTFTAPAGIAKLTAVVVGAGGGRVSDNGDYAGGGGDVIYVASVDISAPVNITVGETVDGSAQQGGASSVNSDVATGGYSGLNDSSGWIDGWGGYSGNGHAGWSDYFLASGGGAGGDAVDQNTGGPGVTASAIANDPVLWPATVGEVAFGAGGHAIGPVSFSGDGGAGANADGTFGVDGTVILRWDPTPVEPALVNTGLTTASIVLGAMFAGVLFFFASGSFSAKSRLQFAGSRDRLVSLLRDTDARLRQAENSDADETKH